MIRTEAILGIDLGSTSSRAFIWCPSKNAKYHVDTKQRTTAAWTKHEKSDFSSIGHPFDGQEVYLGGDLDPDRISTSLKFGFYVLANASDELIEQYPLVQPLLDRRNDPAFRDRLSDGLKSLLTSIQVRVKQICDAKRLAITSIGLTVPAQWDLDFENIYQELVAEVFHHPPSDIYFHTETQALAHFLFKDHREELQDNGSNDVLLFLDFGGHNMNGCLFKVMYGEEGIENFYRVGESFGAGGGSEQWEYNIGLLCDKYLQRSKNYRFCARNRQFLLDEFSQQKTTLGPENDSTISLSVDRDGVVWRLVLEPHEINKCFEDALKAPLQIAADRIARLSNLKLESPRVVVSGGTSRNRSLQSRLRALCADAKLPEPLFTDVLDIDYETAKIAKGAAYATGSQGTVMDFFQRGAAFGIQMKQNATNGNTNPDQLWDDTAVFLLDEERQISQKFKCTGRDELKIVCDPFWAAPGRTRDHEELQCNRCYDILYLGRPKQGNWYFKLALVDTGDSMNLSVQRSRRSYKSTAIQHVDTTLFPLQFDGGTNCVYVGVRGHSLEDIGLGNWVEANPGEDEPSLINADHSPVQDTISVASSTVDLGEYDISIQTLPCQDLRGGAHEGVHGDQDTEPESILPPLFEPRAKPSGSLRNNAFQPFKKPRLG